MKKKNKNIIHYKITKKNKYEYIKKIQWKNLKMK